MGMFKVRVKVANPAKPHLCFEEDFWVDSGAMYSFVPEDRLAAIGLQPTHSRDLLMADGRRERRSLGEALFTLPELNETLTSQVIFAPQNSLYLLGAMTLEVFGVEVDPIAKKLKRILAIIGGYRASK